MSIRPCYANWTDEFVLRKYFKNFRETFNRNQHPCTSAIFKLKLSMLKNSLFTLLSLLPSPSSHNASSAKIIHQISTPPNAQKNPHNLGMKSQFVLPQKLFLLEEKNKSISLLPRLKKPRNFVAHIHLIHLVLEDRYHHLNCRQLAYRLDPRESRGMHRRGRTWRLYPCKYSRMSSSLAGRT